MDKVRFRDKDSSPALSIVIVSFNVREYLRACLTSVIGTTGNVDFEVLVIDNDSSDGSQEMVRSEFPGVELIENRDNVGFARANNMAFAKSRGRVLLMLNPDTEIVENSLASIVEHIELESGVGAVGCKLLNSDRTLQRSCYDFPTLREAFGAYIAGAGALGGLKRFDYDKKHRVDFVRGAFVALNRRCLDEIGLLDERFFMFGEETDLCYRMKQKGWSVVYLPDTVVVHHKGRSTDVLSDRMYTERIRSLIRYFRKHHGRAKTLLLRAIIFFGVFSRLAVGSLPGAASLLTGRPPRSRAAHLRALGLVLRPDE